MADKHGFICSFTIKCKGVRLINDFKTKEHSPQSLLNNEVYEHYASYVQHLLECKTDNICIQVDETDFNSF